MTGDDLRDAVVQLALDRIGGTATVTVERNIGLLGHVFGGRHAASRNPGGRRNPDLGRPAGRRTDLGKNERDLITTGASLTSLALGYLFGSRIG